MRLIPLLEMFQRAHPDIDIRMAASDVTVDLDTTDVDLAQHALVKASDAHRSKHMHWLTWQRWFETQGLKNLVPKRWLYVNYAHQIAQAAATGQGIALAHMPLVADSLASGDLVEPLPSMRIDSPLAYSLPIRLAHRHATYSGLALFG
jgi:LysR family glycine cleavage system transcriptional activator